MRAIIRRTLAICSALLVACDEDNGTGPSPSIAVSAPAVTVQASRTIPVSVRVTRLGGFDGVVALEVVDVPAGITAALSYRVLPDHTNLGLLNVSAAYAVPPGTYAMGIHANGEGVEEAKTNLTLTVTAPPTFTLTIEPSVLEYRPGDPDVTARVTIVPANGFDRPVSFTLERPDALAGWVGLPYNSVADRYVDVIVGVFSWGPGLEFDPPPAGIYTLTIRGRCPGFPDQTVPLTVTILAP